MKKSPHRSQHLKKKAIHQANKMLEEGVESDDSMPKRMHAVQEETLSEEKKHKRTSKRTSTEDTQRETSRASTHNEEPRWSKAKQSQTKEQNLRLEHRLNHQKKGG